MRTLSVYNTQDLKQPLSVVGTNISPATLMPFYDPDTHLLFLTGKVHPHILRTGRDGEEEWGRGWGGGIGRRDGEEEGLALDTIDFYPLLIVA